MQTKTTCLTLMLALSAGLLPPVAQAHGDREWRRDYREHHYRHDNYREYRSYGPPVRVYREEYRVQRAPRHVVEERYYYDAPRRYRRDPAIVIGIDIPPLIIPFR